MDLAQSPDSAADVPRLLQLRNSVFSEKARWALDYKAVPYQEVNLPPGMHTLILRVRGWGTTVPVLLTAGDALPDSTEIIARLEELRPDPPLYPKDQSSLRCALALEEFFDEHCGHEVRRVGLDEMLDDSRSFRARMLAGEPRVVRGVARVARPMVKRQVRRRYGIAPASVDAARETVRTALDRVEAQLQPSGYLVGDRFSVADLTAAALLAPLVLPSHMPGPSSDEIRLPAGLEEFRASLRAHPGFEWVNEMYRRHRGTSAAIGDGRRS